MENGRKHNERITFTEYETSLSWILYIDNDPSADKDAIDRQKPIQGTDFINRQNFNYEEADILIYGSLNDCLF